MGETTEEDPDGAGGGLITRGSLFSAKDLGVY